ncbi:MAG: hypothetical protein AAB975_03480 [Patescibacteria group bacterium]
MSELIFRTSANVDADINLMARQLGISTSDVAFMTKAVIMKALNLCKYVLNEKGNGGRIFIDNYKSEIRKEIHKI